MSLIGLGFTLQVDDGASNAFQSIDDIVHITPPTEGEVGVAESKRLNLTAGVITSVATLTNPGEFTFTYEYLKATKDRLDALIKTAKNWKYTCPETTSPRVKTVPGFLVSNSIDEVVADGIMTVTAKVRVTGPAT